MATENIVYFNGLKRKRSRIKASITRIENFIRDLDYESFDINEVQIREGILTKSFEEYDKIQDLIEEWVMINDPQKTDEELVEREDIEKKCITLLSKLKTIVQRETQSNSGASSGVAFGGQEIFHVPSHINISNRQGGKVKLPSFNIPIFKGCYSEWQMFIDLFTASVHNDPNLANSQKFMYLKSFLKDEPLSLISEISISNDNYDRALDILKTHYDKKLPVINYHINGLVQATVSKGPNGLREFTRKIKQHINALESLDVKVTGSWDLILINILSNQLSSRLKSEFELERNQATLPTLNAFLEFLEKRVSAWEISSPGNDQQRKLSDRKFHKQGHVTATHMSTNTNRGHRGGIKCVYCNSEHSVYKCEKFAALSIQDRREFVMKNKLCFLCFSNNHGVAVCKKDRCKICSGRHSTLLHEQKELSHQKTKIGKDAADQQIHNNDNNTESGYNSQETQTTLACLKSPQEVCQTSTNNKTVLLATARVHLRAKNGNVVEARALLDSGSQSSFVSADVVKRLGLKSYKTNLIVSGIAESKNHVSGMVNLVVESMNSDFKIELSCGILRKITCDLPQQRVDVESIIPSHITLADGKFNEPSKIDMLIGSDAYFEIMGTGQIKLGSNSPVLLNTKLGWIVGGKISANSFSTNSYLSVSMHSTVVDVDELIPKFWQLEEISTKRTLTSEDKICEKIFLNTSTRAEDGRFIVNLPLKNSVENLGLGDSFEYAKRRFISLEKRLLKIPALMTQYREFIDEYVRLGHGKYVDLSTKTKNSLTKYFLPHHCVIKEESKTTKLRVVFDASMPTTTGLSLNDVMYKGPTVQPELFDIVCRFRQFRYVVSADIVKMYRQVWITPSHRHLQNILWRAHPDDDLKCIELQTATYGTNSAPYLATRSLTELAYQNETSFPIAYHVIKNQFYVDDILTGSDSIKDLQRLVQELIILLSSAGFNLHKWVTNTDCDVLHEVSNDSIDETSIYVDKQFTKVLGISWQPSSDVFKICGMKVELNSNPTKRNVLSYIASLFDPLGFIGPVVVLGKILMQEIWVSKIGWDETLPKELQEKWFNFSQNLHLLDNIKIPRHLFTDVEIRYVELHGFSDASLKAYGTCFYMRTISSNNEVTCKLICSKSRVAPLKVISLPRLELNGFLIMARMCHRLREIFEVKFARTVLWTDSTIVLNWLQGSPTRWTTFVANRVSEIQELSTNVEWRHVLSEENPADHISRGLDPSKIGSCEHWWNGPNFLYDPNLSFGKNHFEVPENDIPEQKTISNISVKSVPEMMNMFSKFSNFTRLQRTVAYCFRFVNNCKKRSNKISGTLTVSELRLASECIIKIVQGYYYQEEIKILSSGHSIEIGTLLQLTPFLDSKGLLRISGRLSNSHLSFDQKHPIIVPPKDYVSRLLYRKFHIDLFHAGPQAVLTNMRQTFWPVNGLRQIKGEIKRCMTCHRFKAAVAKQLMGALPSERVNLVRPFFTVGIDFGGPIQYKESKLRKGVVSKSYIALFICMATKAIHIELVSNLSTEAFLMSLKRFIARRGCPQVIYSDNGTNFQGANNSLKDIYHFLRNSKDEIQDFLGYREIKWKYIPPSSPHWGGLWEAGIKSTKFHLKRVLGNSILNFEGLCTLLYQIEYILNSRPLTPLSSDPNDLSCLTPNHFLIGENSMEIPEHNVSNVPDNRLKSWEQISKMKHIFWEKWSKEYLNRLQSRPKWATPQINIDVGQLVLIKDDNMTPLQWHLGRVVEALPGSDCKTRVVKLKTQNGTYTRPITKLCPLPFASD